MACRPHHRQPTRSFRCRRRRRSGGYLGWEFWSLVWSVGLFSPPCFDGFAARWLMPSLTASPRHGARGPAAWAPSGEDADDRRAGRRCEKTIYFWSFALVDPFMKFARILKHLAFYFILFSRGFIWARPYPCQLRPGPSPIVSTRSDSTILFCTRRLAPSVRSPRLYVARATNLMTIA